MTAACEHNECQNDTENVLNENVKYTKQSQVIPLYILNVCVCVYVCVCILCNSVITTVVPLQ